MVGVRLLPLPPKEALDYFRSKGLAPIDESFDHRDIWRGQHAVSFVVAKAAREDVLKLIRDELTREMEEGWPLARFQAELKPKLVAAGWWGRGMLRDPQGPAPEVEQDVQMGSMHRLRVIFDTNMRTSMAAGRWARLWRNRDAFPYLAYHQIDRPTRRLNHKRFDGGVWRIDDPIWERIYPPNGWFCGCSVEPITQGQIDRGSFTLSPPLDLDEVEWFNERTGQTEMIPFGVHPGFDVNPGLIRQRMDDAFAPTGLDTRHELALLAADLEERMRREGIERAIAVQSGQPVHIRYIGESTAVGIDDRVGPGADVIHSHPDFPALSEADIWLLQKRQFRSIFGVTPEGEVFGALAEPGGDLIFHGATKRFLREWGQPGNVWELTGATEWERMTLQGHALAMWLEKSGAITYFRPRGRRFDALLAKYAALLDVVSRAHS